MKPRIQVTNELFFKLGTIVSLCMKIYSNVEAQACTKKPSSRALFKKEALICVTFFAATSQGGLRERFALPSAKFLKSIFSFGARHACVILRRHILVTSYVVATRFFSHIVSVSATSRK